MGSWHKREKKLRAAGVAPSMGHAQRAPKMTAIVGPVALVVDRISWTALAVVSLCAALRHELGQHAMKRTAAVKALLHERNKIRNRLRRFVLEKLNRDLALGRGQLHARQIVGLCFRSSDLRLLLP